MMIMHCGEVQGGFLKVCIVLFALFLFISEFMKFSIIEFRHTHL